ncbi:STAS/SEC14 domain-containing protein [Bosea sp. NBC_00550]|uniref:STAS/SEC14 domain-containing protein n=1 Tax=Bosea sp. NBC_00550 TaxID=2969621 RepID=UPI0022325E43|nr:STAS/SEC14 domain-containing protein [Bosea sp. NBC_00550]UZF91130.1 STAS/SEC14 domain-containing protein [Bosea sp. NBC_00550]
MVDAPSFPGWEGIGALISHLEFARGHHRTIERVAVVSDGEVLKLVPHIAKHFVADEIRLFPANEKALALAWLEASSTRGLGRRSMTSVSDAA